LKYLGLSAGKFVNECVAQNSTIRDFFGLAQKESNRVVCENINDTNKQKHRKIMLPDSNKASSAGNSFFMNYLKQHGAIKCAETSSSVVSVDTHESRQLDNVNLPKSKHVLDTNSDDDMFESPVTMVEKQKEDKSNTVVRTTTAELNLEVPTLMIESQADDDTSKMWVSLGELFPDISKIDDEVVALLPVPLQERLQARIEEAKKNSRINSKCALTNITTSSNNIIDTTDSCFAGSNSQDETKEGAKDVKAFVHAAKCIMQSETETQSCNKNTLPKATNVSYNSDDQKVDLLSESRCVLQHTKEENLGQIQVCDGIFPPDAKQQYLNASHVPFVSEENHAEDSESTVAEYCPQCRKDVPLYEYAEHLDFHTAEKLHKELNGVEMHVTDTLNASALHKNPSLELPTKRKHNPLCKKPSMIDRNKKMKSITAFFAPK
jgi:hypothetical protein